MIITNSIIGWIVTGDILKGLSIGLLTFFVNSTVYLFHERVWNLSRWGQK